MKFQKFFTLALMAASLVSANTQGHEFRLVQVSDENLNLQLMITHMKLKVYRGDIELISECRDCSFTLSGKRCSKFVHSAHCGARFNELFHYVEGIIRSQYKAIRRAPEKNFVVLANGKSLNLAYGK